MKLVEHCDPSASTLSIEHKLSIVWDKILPVFGVIGVIETVSDCVFGVEDNLAECDVQRVKALDRVYGSLNRCCFLIQQVVRCDRIDSEEN